jgi:signal transduction histidine kinase
MKSAAAAHAPNSELKHQVAIVNLYSLVAFIYLAIFTPLFLLMYHKTGLGLIHALDTLLILALVIYVNTQKTVKYAAIVLSAIAVGTIPPLTLDGGVEQSGLFFALPAAIFIFFLSPRRISIRWLLAMFTPLTLALVAAWLGLITLPYERLTFTFFIMSFGFSIVLLYMYASEKDKLDQQILRLTENLKREKASVERKVAERTRELGEAQSELIASISGMPFGFAVVDQQNQILFANEVLAKMVNRPIPSDPAASREALQQIAADYAPAIDLLGQIRAAQDHLRPIEQNIVFGPRYFRFFFMPITAPKGKGVRVIGTVVIVEDTTEEKALQRSRDEFFSIASHELRTPLTAIRGNADMMLGYYKEQLQDPGLHEMVGDIHTASLRLIDIVNDFLDMSRLEQGKFVFKNEPFDIVPLLQQIVHEYTTVGDLHQLEIKFNPPPQASMNVVADKDRVNQIVVNLLSNALKFTAAGSVTLDITAQGEELKLAVTDTGNGIPEESRHLLFHKFQQASNNILTRDNTQSTGLGLYISKLLAEGMHGKLYLERSKVGHGSTFVLELILQSK